MQIPAVCPPKRLVLDAYSSVVNHHLKHDLMHEVSHHIPPTFSLSSKQLMVQTPDRTREESANTLRTASPFAPAPITQTLCLSRALKSGRGSSELHSDVRLRESRIVRHEPTTCSAMANVERLEVSVPGPGAAFYGCMHTVRIAKTYSSGEGCLRRGVGGEVQEVDGRSSQLPSGVTSGLCMVRIAQHVNSYHTCAFALDPHFYQYCTGHHIVQVYAN